jgi:hypothetical protein
MLLVVINWLLTKTLCFMMIGNQRLQRQFDGLLMMGIIMPETCWAVSVWQSNKILQPIVASSWVFYSSTCNMFTKQKITSTNIFLASIDYNDGILTILYLYCLLSLSRSPRISIPLAFAINFCPARNVPLDSLISLRVTGW